MDITPQDSAATQSISDDQELAQALAGVLPEQEAEATPEESFSFDDSSTPTVSTQAVAPADPTAPAVTAGAFADATATPAPAPALESPFASTPSASAPDSAPSVANTPSAPSPVTSPIGSSPDLNNIKSNALDALRPLIGKVDLPAEEKFDTYLMLIRSTDDASLIEPAHVAAQGIEDEKRKAEALLEIIKEIDYLSRKDQEPKA